MLHEVGEAQVNEFRSQEELTNFRRSVDGILTDVEVATDAMREFFKKELRLLEERVSGTTVRSLGSLRERLCDAARGDSPEHRLFVSE